MYELSTSTFLSSSLCKVIVILLTVAVCLNQYKQTDRQVYRFNKYNDIINVHLKNKPLIHVISSIRTKT